MTTGELKTVNNRKEINEGRLKVVDAYMKFYSDLIKDAIFRNNSEIHL